MKALVALALVGFGFLTAIGGYWLGRSGNNVRAVTRPLTVSKPPKPQPKSRFLLLRDGDSFRDPRTGTSCQLTGEAGTPNIFCTHGREMSSRFQVVFWADRADLYDVSRHGEPMVPTYSVPSK
jgi:hypothetical protein